MRPAWAQASLARSSQYFSSSSLDDTCRGPPLLHDNVRLDLVFRGVRIFIAIVTMVPQHMRAHLQLLTFREFCQLLIGRCEIGHLHGFSARLSSAALPVLGNVERGWHCIR